MSIGDVITLWLLLAFAVLWLWFGWWWFFDGGEHKFEQWLGDKMAQRAEKRRRQDKKGQQ